MPALIDTSIAIHLRDLDGAILDKVATLDATPCLSLLSLAELAGGLHKSPELAFIRRARLDALVARLRILPFDREVVDIYERIVARVGFERRTMIDRLLAATAIKHGMDLITTNPRDFRPIPDLRLVDWSNAA